MAWSYLEFPNHWRCFAGEFVVLVFRGSKLMWRIAICRKWVKASYSPLSMVVDSNPSQSWTPSCGIRCLGENLNNLRELHYQLPRDSSTHVFGSLSFTAIWPVPAPQPILNQTFGRERAADKVTGFQIGVEQMHTYTQVYNMTNE